MSVQSYLDHEGQLCLELARFMELDKALIGDTEAAWNAYHGCVPLPQADCLLEGGTSDIGEQYRSCLELGVAYHGSVPLPLADCLLEGSTFGLGEAASMQGAHVCSCVRNTGRFLKEEFPFAFLRGPIKDSRDQSLNKHKRKLFWGFLALSPHLF